jgi:hypothetical protein
MSTAAIILWVIFLTSIAVLLLGGYLIKRLFDMEINTPIEPTMHTMAILIVGVVTAITILSGLISGIMLIFIP